MVRVEWRDLGEGGVERLRKEWRYCGEGGVERSW